MSELQQFKGVGPKRLENLKVAGIDSLETLLNTLPRDYLHAQKTISISALKEGEVCIFAEALAPVITQYFGGRSLSRTTFGDDSGKIQAIWFNQPWSSKQIEPGKRILLAGKVQVYRGRLHILNPKCLERIGIYPSYPSFPSIPNSVFVSIIKQALDIVAGKSFENLPESFCQRYNLIGKIDAWRMAHQPNSLNEIEKAKRRMAFENLLLFRMAMQLARPQEQDGIPIESDKFKLNEFWSSLPFLPTSAQTRTLNQIVDDLKQSKPMRRLVQGDVGSGKTAVALGAASYVIDAGYQVALMAPTELLAQQHYKTAERLLSSSGIRYGIITGSMKAAQKRRAMQYINRGEWDLIIGTHSLIGQEIHYHNLALVITDEQHRFGVRQRQTLAEKAGDYKAPHILALSATPIPRSLALTLYADLQVSVMDELPPGRQQVKTRIVPENRRMDLYRYIKEKAKSGEQSFLVCPLVEDSEITEAASAFGLYAQLSRSVFKEIPMELTYGGQPADEKEKALSNFYSGKSKVLVSTTVIEVGMDAPNATTMVIENADYFGLAQLHQLRGRVGRGEKESWCFLLGNRNERLETLTKTNDGFQIAQKDLELRGPGEFLGNRQHGRMLNIYGISDLRLIEEVNTCLEDIITDPQQSELRLLLEQLAEQRYASQLQDAALH